jgi:hypothetical protein
MMVRKFGALIPTSIVAGRSGVQEPTGRIEMKKLIALLTLVALGLVPAAGQASKSKRARVYKGTFEAVGAEGAYSNDKFGKAQLVDGRRNDKLSVHMRRLAPRTQYAFRLQQAARACEEGAPGGTDVPGWTYRRAGVFTTNRKGGANSKARSRSFTAERGVEYLVAVYTLSPTGELGELVLCAELKGKKRGHGKGGKHHPKHRGHHKSGQRRDDKRHDTKPEKSKRLRMG